MLILVCVTRSLHFTATPGSSDDSENWAPRLTAGAETPKVGNPSGSETCTEQPAQAQPTGHGEHKQTVGSGAWRPMKALEARRREGGGATGFQAVRGLAPRHPEQAEDTVKRTGRGEGQGSWTGGGYLESALRQIRNSQGPWAISSG